MLKQTLSNRITKIYVLLFLFAGFLFIPLDIANTVEKTKKGWLGVRVQEMTPSLKEAYEVGDRSGLLIAEVMHGSPADDAGLREEDVIVEFDGKPVEKADDFARMVRKTAPRTNVTVLIIRDGKEKEIEVTLGRRKVRLRGPTCWSGENFVIVTGKPRLGVRIQELNEDLAPYFKVEEYSGVLISEVTEDSPAEEAGLKAGDVITKIDDEEISDPEDLIEALNEYDEGDVITVEYVRKGKTEKVEVELEESAFPNIRIRRPGGPRIQIHRFAPDLLHAPEMIIRHLTPDFDAI